jgi:hypothetical protein
MIRPVERPDWLDNSCSRQHGNGIQSRDSRPPCLYAGLQARVALPPPGPLACSGLDPPSQCGARWAGPSRLPGWAVFLLWARGKLLIESSSAILSDGNILFYLFQTSKILIIEYIYIIIDISFLYLQFKHLCISSLHNSRVYQVLMTVFLLALRYHSRYQTFVYLQFA